MTSLTAEDLKALKTADKIVFRHLKGVSTIEAGLDGGYAGDQPRIFTASEQRLFPSADSLRITERQRVITVPGSVTWYEGDDRRYGQGEDAHAFAWVPSAQYNDIWKTIASLLKVGDELELAFNGDAYSNGHTKTAGLHADACRLHVERTVRGSRQRLVFEVDHSICADNTARMVKPATYSYSLR